ncbi:hypothetical protein LV83_00960 [Algoriphagus yeomjeoni]|uniref:Uncharacterized protein n=1 Tax=Algoriphagus yeomjeoni TaxID=291403 RepID=A0A327PQN4_9BACT|nr:hypothetical protein LV83_00960 [Algoriphagus yeomjeoni]
MKQSCINGINGKKLKGIDVLVCDWAGVVCFFRHRKSHLDDSLSFSDIFSDLKILILTFSQWNLP